MWSRVIGLDIETDTSPDAEEVGLGDGPAEVSCERPLPRGLDPRGSSVVAIAVSGRDESRVFDLGSCGSEAGVLSALDEFLRGLEPGVIVTWNGSGFDLPFIAERAQILGLGLGLQTAIDTSLSPKYPNAALPGACVASWLSSGPVPHAHLDIAFAFRSFCELTGTSWSLKPTAMALGFNPVEVDRTSIHSLSPVELFEYVLSDALCTRLLAEMVLSGSIRAGLG